MFKRKFFENQYNRMMHKELNKNHKIVDDNEEKTLFSIIVACYNTPLKLFEEMVDSVIRQSYGNWELCIADGSENTSIKDYVNLKYRENKKIKYKFLGGNGGISENMNAAITMAVGDCIAFFDHDDLLMPNALAEMNKFIKEHDDAQMIYSDEDKTNEFADRYFFPNFKPDFNFDLLLTSNYICHFLVVKRQLLKEVGFFRKKYDGAQDYDFVLRCVSHLKGEGIYHIPKILYHWRVHEGSTAGKTENKSWAFDAGKEALRDYLQSNHIKASVENSFAPGYYRVKYHLNEESFVSIIITNVKTKEILNKCIESIKSHTHYDHYEIIVVGNNDVVKDCYYNDVIYIRTDVGNNDSMSKNIGAKHANGSFLLFLNSSLLIEDDDWLTEMLGISQRPNTGIVGCMLLTRNQKIVHAGIIIGKNGKMLYPYRRRHKETLGYNGYVQSIRDYSAVSSDCFMLNKKLFDEVGGFKETLNPSMSGIDLCLKVRNLNKLVVYDPFVCLSFAVIHANRKALKTERDYFLNRWHLYTVADPAYNQHFSYRHAFMLDIHSKL